LFLAIGLEFIMGATTVCFTVCLCFAAALMPLARKLFRPLHGIRHQIAITYGEAHKNQNLNTGKYFIHKVLNPNESEE